MLTPRSQPALFMAMNSSPVPWVQVAIIMPSGCQTVRKRSQSPASRQSTQFSIRSRRASRSRVSRSTVGLLVQCSTQGKRIHSRDGKVAPRR